MSSSRIAHAPTHNALYHLRITNCLRTLACTLSRTLSSTIHQLYQSPTRTGFDAHSLAFSLAHTDTHSYSLSLSHTHTHTHTLTLTLTQSLTLIYTHAHSLTHTHTHTHRTRGLGLIQKTFCTNVENKILMGINVNSCYYWNQNAVISIKYCVGDGYGVATVSRVD